ncbi:toll/interleukin-1 receptor domain-containing protein [Nodosilinea sp. PGN35]|uniref:toll/interleukin-1 receptor domain-containing protein n=1 Tax=Nodosilinea sp. PGN35 TaxID=3020489 RepID=UPI0023B29812|nr:toll/interleukin-1 receptor domain-containing protein [Nodosilinea sp. TSF1-S3]MDF0367089.1 toll/interleukin-1 receptor domain-containing protein [Nodosilinea sp. TSF1-S3]
MQTQEIFDVFLAHNSKDKDQVRLICSHLRQEGLKPWLDEEGILPGNWFQDVIQGIIRKARSIAIFLGPHEMGRWQMLESRAAMQRCVEEGVPLIPVLLPGALKIPDEFSFLNQLHAVAFNHINDLDALQKLVRGIKFGIKGSHSPETRKDIYGIFVPIESTRCFGSTCFLAIEAPRDSPLLDAICQAVKKSGLQKIPENVHEVPPFQDLIANMKSAQIVIAAPDIKDYTNLDLNINFEIGLACALGKPLMVVTSKREELLKHLPGGMPLADIIEYLPEDLKFDNLNKLSNKISEKINKICERLSPPFLTDPKFEGIRIACGTHRICLEPGFWENFGSILSFTRNIQEMLHSISPLLPRMKDSLARAYESSRSKDKRTIYQRCLSEFYEKYHQYIINTGGIENYLKSEVFEEVNESLEFFLSKLENMSEIGRIEVIKNSIDLLKSNIELDFSRLVKDHLKFKDILKNDPLDDDKISELLGVVERLSTFNYCILQHIKAIESNLIKTID